MPILLDRFDDGDLCFGHTWTVQDVGLLAEVVAQLVLGSSLHADRIMAGAEPAPVLARPQTVRKQIDLLTLNFVGEEAREGMRYVRDGWIFQLISWVAANGAAGDGELVRAPHPQPADKGLDGLLIQRCPNDGHWIRLVICEDKATEDARRTVREQVWPELVSFEQYERDELIVQEVSTLLAQAEGPHSILDAVAAIAREAYSYRVAITITETHADQAGRMRLFKDYDTTVAGPDTVRRRAETFLCLPEVRAWMDGFCVEIVDRLRPLAA